MSGSTKNILRVLFSLCLLIMMVDPFIEREHSHFVWENWSGFYGTFGFFSGVVLVLVAKYVLRPLVSREEEEL